MFNIEMLRELVLAHGNTSDIALSGKDAVNIVTSRLNSLHSSQKAAVSMYKLILVDYSMPEMDGPALVKRIKELMSNNVVQAGQPGNTPYICCCSAYDDIDFKRQAEEAGMQSFLTKPVTWEEIRSVLKTSGLPFDQNV